MQDTAAAELHAINRHQTRLRVGLGSPNLTCQLFGLPYVIAVENGRKVAARHTGRLRCAKRLPDLSAVRLEVDPEAVKLLEGLVGRPVVHDDELVGPERLVEHAANRCRDILLLIVAVTTTLSRDAIDRRQLPERCAVVSV